MLFHGGWKKNTFFLITIALAINGITRIQPQKTRIRGWAEKVHSAKGRTSILSMEIVVS
jgi:hypothetical protein